MKTKLKSKLIESHRKSIGNDQHVITRMRIETGRSKSQSIGIETPQISLQWDKDYLQKDEEEAIFLFLPSA